MLLCILYWTTLSCASETLYVTDRVAAAMYPAPRAASKPLQYLPTGTILRRLVEQNDFIRVRTPEGTEGWIQRSQLQEDVPAQVVLLSLVQQHEQTIRELDKTQQQLAETEAIVQSRQGTRAWLALVIVLITFSSGFLLGIFWLDWRLRERHGGFRL